VRTGHFVASNFAKSQPIVKIISMLERARHFQQDIVPQNLKYVGALPWEVLEIHFYAALQKMLLKRVAYHMR